MKEERNLVEGLDLTELCFIFFGTHFSNPATNKRTTETAVLELRGLGLIWVFGRVTVIDAAI